MSFSIKSLALLFAFVVLGSAFTLPNDYQSEYNENDNRFAFEEEDAGDFLAAYSPDASAFNDYYPQELVAAELARRHKRSPQFNVGVGAEHNRRYGTDVNVNANGRLWTGNRGQSTLDANANYNRHFGGQMGTGRPNYGAGVTFRHNF